MEAASQKQAVGGLNVFLIGNNPIELSAIYKQLKSIRKEEIQAEIVFEMKGLYQRIKRMRPSCIFIDDNVQYAQVKKMLKRLSGNALTREIPITVIKNSNYTQGYSEANDYLLKEKITSESLYASIKNAMRLKKMQLFMLKKYRRNKSRLLGFLNS